MNSSPSGSAPYRCTGDDNPPFQAAATGFPPEFDRGLELVFGVGQRGLRGFNLARICCDVMSENRMNGSSHFDDIPDVRDGLTQKERAILYCLQQAQQERGGRNVPTVMLYGRVVELVDISEQEFQTILARFVGMTRPSSDE